MNKVVSTKNEWVVRIVTTIPLTKTPYTIQENCKTRKKAREYMRIFKSTFKGDSVKLYKSVEVGFDDGQIFISMVKAR